MDAATVGKLFKIDEKRDNISTDGKKGTGLGLILSQELAEKNGGVISVESEPGKGASFFLKLPSA
jgi:signal transduction histidine kinase